MPPCLYVVSSGDSQHDQPARFVLVTHFDELRHFLATRTTPRGPQIHRSTLSCRCNSLNDPPSRVCSLVSRTLAGRTTNAPGAGLFRKGVVPGELPGEVFADETPFVGGAVSFELQLDRPSAPSADSATKLTTMRPAVQKFCRAGSCLRPELSVEPMNTLSFVRGCHDAKR